MVYTSKQDVWVITSNLTIYTDIFIQSWHAVSYEKGNKQMELYSHSPSITSIAPGVRRKKKKNKKHITLSAHCPISDFTKLESAAVISLRNTDKKKACLCLTHWIIKNLLTRNFLNVFFYFFILLQCSSWLTKSSNCVPVRCLTDNHLYK